MSSFSYAVSLENIQFRANHYTRDLKRDIIYAKGDAWLKQPNREVWADEITIDFGQQTASAEGNVHIVEKPFDIWCQTATHKLDTDSATFQNATIISRQLVITGKHVRRLDADTFEVDEGSYTNCNNNNNKTESAGTCEYPWKIHGKYMHLEVEGYAHVHDAILYLKELPVAYTPYFIAPAKSERQTGLLNVRLTGQDTLGSGVTLPFFIALGAWHDMTLFPTYYSKTGFSLGLEYRYAYSKTTKGDFWFQFTERKFSDQRDHPELLPSNPSRIAGIIGEYAIDVTNRFSFGRRGKSIQSLRAVSHPYFVYDYASAHFEKYRPSLRSQWSAWIPSDHDLFSAEILHHQSLILSKDDGIDRGAVTQLPSISYSSTTQPLYRTLLSTELDLNFTNFFRPTVGYDSVPSSLDPSTVTTELHTDPDPNYHFGDYIRTGRRLHIEPRAVVTVPMPRGLTLQPLLKAGTLLYHFDFPSSHFIHRDYVEVKVPLSLSLSKTFETSIEGAEQINHTLQPRVLYGARWTKRNPTDPFFYENTARGLSNPRFDYLDLLTPFEYFRFELINRFHRKSNGTIERFFLLQLSEQYNSRTFAEDSRFQHHLGPLELLTQLDIWRFGAQIEAKYQIETSTRADGSKMHEYDWSSSLRYRAPQGDYLKLNNRFRIRADPTLTEQYLELTALKTLPILFDMRGGVEYSLKRGEIQAYYAGLHFATKPRTCWQVDVLIGRDSRKRSYFEIEFNLDFGNPGSAISR